MRKNLLLYILLLQLISLSSFAQEKGDGRIFVSLAAGTQSALNSSGESSLGLGTTVTGDYFFIDKLALVTSYTFFFPSNQVIISGVKVGINADAFNIGGKYYILTKGVDLYGLFGISFASATASFTDITGTETEIKSNETGFNVGGGIDFHLGEKWVLTGQAKYNSPLEQMVFNVGIGFSL